MINGGLQMNPKFYIDTVKITYIEGNERKRLDFDSSNLNDIAIEKIKELTFSNELCTLSMENEEDCLSMVINRENKSTHIGVVNLYDDEIYYYDNGSKSEELIPINGNYYETWSVCADYDLVWECINTYMLNGERTDKVDWIEDEM